MRLELVLGVAALLLVGCAQRDNPYDPANKNDPERPPPPPVEFHPLPGPDNIVIWPDSAGSRGNPTQYVGGLQTGFGQARGGDTVWIHGEEYEIKGQLTLYQYASELMPIVIRSFGGPAIIQYVGTSSLDEVCLPIDQGYVKIVGVTFRNCRKAIFASNFSGWLVLDSVTFDRNYAALDIQQVRGKVSLSNIVLQGNTDSPPYFFAKIDSLDTTAFVWVR